MSQPPDKTNIIQFPQTEFVRIWKGEMAGEGTVYLIDSVLGDDEAGIAYFRTLDEVRENLPRLIVPGMRVQWDIDDEDRG